MSITLNATTQAKLDQFRRRRRLMMIARGGCAAMVTWSVALLAVALIDWLWVVPAELRWCLSIASYTAGFGTLWWICLRHWRCDSQRAALAWRMEAARPELRDQLLAAVELADGPTRVPSGSATFRAMVQESVGRRMAALHVPSLLPWRLIRWWLVAMASVVGLLAGLLLLPGLPFRQLMTRAMLPMANIDRVSRTQVAIVQPTPHSLMVPRGETIAFVVEIGGAGADSATLEWFPDDDAPRTSQMRRHDQHRFVANLTIDAPSLDYRIRAGDAVTRHYRIESQPRPTVESFEKRFQYPTYSQLPAKTVVETDGNLSALEGTTVELLLKLDQDVSAATLRLQMLGDSTLSTIDLQRVEPQRYLARIPIARSAVYQVRLVAEHSGFDNPFAPRYEIQPQPDQIPRVSFVSAPPTPVLLPPTDILRLQGTVDDELPLARVQHEISINGHDWQSTELAVDVARQLQVQWDCDLALYGLQAGDRVAVRLAAIDLRGQRGETVPLQVLIASPEFDPYRHRVMQQRLALLDPVWQWTQRVRLLRTAVEDGLAPHAANQDDSDAPDPPTDDALATLRQSAAEIHAHGDALIGAIREILPQMPAGTDSAQLEWTGRAVDRVLFDAAAMQHWTVADAAVLEPGQRAAAESLQQRAKRWQQHATAMGDLADRLHDAYRSFVAHHVIAAVIRDLDALHRHVARLSVPEVPLPWNRLVRQHAITVSRMQGIEDLIDATADPLASSTQNALRGTADWLASQRQQLQQQLKAEDPSQEQEQQQRRADDLRLANRKLTDEIELRLRTVMIDGSLPAAVVRGQQELHRRSGAVSRSIAEYVTPLRHLETLAVQASAADDAAAVRVANQQATLQRISLQHAVRRIQQRLQNQSELHSMRSDGDPQFAADASNTRRALSTVLQPLPDESPSNDRKPTKASAAIEELGNAFGILEAGHDAVQQRSDLQTLIAKERWNAMTVEGRIEHPQLWEQVQKGFELAASRLRDAQVPRTISDAVARLQHGAHSAAIAQQMIVRRQNQRNASSVVSELQRIAETFDQLVMELRPLMDDARRRIQSYLPTTAELARGTVEQLRQLRQQTERTAAVLSGDPSSQLQPQSANPSLTPEQLLREEQRIRDQIEEVLQALTDDANTQDLLTDAGRERARDADDAVQMVAPPANAMHRTMQHATTSDKQHAAAKLGESAQHQSKTADRLLQVAEHFQRLEAGQDATETRQMLRDTERQLGLADQMDQAFGEVQQLAGTMQQNPQSLLQQLEDELQQNSEMQSSLSQIAADAALSAQHALQRAAETEAVTRRGIERADQPFHDRKRPSADRMSDVAEAASEAARNLAEPARALAASGKSPQAERSLQAARDALNNAAEAARSVTADSLLDDLHQAARRSAAAAEQAARHLRAAEQVAAGAKDDPLYENERDLASKRRDAENRQRQLKDQRVREARNQQRRLDQQLSRARQEMQKAEAAKKDRQRQLKQTEQELAKQPEQAARQQKIQHTRQQLQQSESALQRAQQYHHQTEQRKTAADQHSRMVQQSPTPSLTQSNPFAELVEQLATQAHEAAQQIAAAAAQVSESTEFGDLLQGSAGQLADAAATQQRIHTEVAQASQDLARAGRHERRLGKLAGEKTLTDAAEGVRRVAEAEVAQAQQRLATAADRSAKADDAVGSPEASAEGKPGASETASSDARASKRQVNAAVQQASQSVAEAQAALNEQANSLGDVLVTDAAVRAKQAAMALAAEDAGTTDATSSTTSTPAGSPRAADSAGTSGSPQASGTGGPTSAAGLAGAATSAGDPERAQSLARTLDELDRALHAPSAPGSDGRPAASAQAAATAPPDTLAALAHASARRMALSRSQAQMQLSPTAASGQGLQSTGESDLGTASADRFEAKPVERSVMDDWGQLQRRAAEEMVESQRDRVSARYGRQVEAYFRALAERAQPSK